MVDKKYQVFISSTFSDLKVERENIIKAILEMYHIPIGMEMFSAEDEDQWEIIRRTIEISDYYILILGLRYGSKTKENISFTQKEYEYALKKNIPILAFVMHDNIPLSKDRRDDDLSEVNTFRNIVLKNSKMAQFWKTVDDLTKSVSIALMKQIMQRPGIGWVRGDKAASEELTLELTSLSKENRELREIIEELKSKIIEKQPQISIENIEFRVDDRFNNFKILRLPSEICIDEIPSRLAKYIDKKDIDDFNKSIPSQEKLDKYNQEYDKFCKMENYSFPLDLKIENSGSLKANNIFIEIQFPSEIIIYENDEKIKAPQSPIKRNPIDYAEQKYLEELKAANRSALHRSLLSIQQSNTSMFNPDIHNNFSNINLSHFRNINKGYRTKLENGILTIHIDNLLHTRRFSLPERYLITPLVGGVYAIKASIICEEFENKVEETFHISILGTT